MEADYDLLMLVCKHPRPATTAVRLGSLSFLNAVYHYSQRVDAVKNDVNKKGAASRWSFGNLKTPLALSLDAPGSLHLFDVLLEMGAVPGAPLEMLAECTSDEAVEKVVEHFGHARLFEKPKGAKGLAWWKKPLQEMFNKGREKVRPVTVFRTC